MTKKLNHKMNLAHITNVLEADVLCGHDYLDKEIEMVYASDLMSDVLAFVKSGSFLLTGLTNSQVIRTAEMAEISAVCFVNGKTPQADTINLAEEKKIPLIVTKSLMYECCGRLHEKGLAGDDDSEKIES